MNNVNISVPEERAEQVRRYLESLNIGNARPEQVVSLPARENGGQGDRETREVSSVRDHRMTGVGFQFLVVFRNGEEEWLPDCDCHCEWLISRYLQTVRITTAYLVCRVSSKGQVGEDHVSLEAQEARLIEKVRMSTHQRVKVFKISASAYHKVPEVLQHVGEAANPGDGIFIYRVDRLTRNIVESLAWMESLNARGVLIYACEEELSYSRSKLDFLEAVIKAHRESENISKRVLEANRRRRERGDQGLGALPYGKKYQRTVDGNLIIVKDSDALKLIKTIKKTPFERLNRLADKWRVEGVKKRGRFWSLRMLEDAHRKNFE